MILDRQRRVEGRDQRTADMFRDDAAALLDERRRRAEEAIQQPDHLPAVRRSDSRVKPSSQRTGAGGCPFSRLKRQCRWISF